MNLIQTLNGWDTELLLMINGCHSRFFDALMWILSDKFTWILFYASVLFVVIRKWTKEALWVILALVMCIVLSDQISSSLIKPLVHRLRPSHNPSLGELVHIVNGYYGGKYGFVSSHAANSVGFAVLSSLLFRERTYTLMVSVWAFLTAYSRMYLGVHYPLDILGGALVGVLGGFLCFRAIQRYRPAITVETKPLKLPYVYITWATTMVGICIYALIHP